MAERPTLTVLICTRQRLQRLEECINSCIDGAKGWPLRIVAGFDDDPDSFYKFRKAVGEAQFPDNVDVVGNLFEPRHYYVRAINELFLWARRSLGDFDYFVLSNDDVEWAPNWPKHAFHGLNKSYPKGMGICELSAPDACAHYISRAQFFVDYFNGRLGEPCYTFYFSDRELMNRANLMGRYRYMTGPDGPLIKHTQHLDTMRREIERWWYRDEFMFFERRVANPEWPDHGVPRQVWNEVFGNAPSS